MDYMLNNELHYYLFGIHIQNTVDFVNNIELFLIFYNFFSIFSNFYINKMEIIFIQFLFQDLDTYISITSRFTPKIQQAKLAILLDFEIYSYR